MLKDVDILKDLWTWLWLQLRRKSTSTVSIGKLLGQTHFGGMLDEKMVLLWMMGDKLTFVDGWGNPGDWQDAPTRSDMTALHPALGCIRKGVWPIQEEMGRATPRISDAQYTAPI